VANKKIEQDGLFQQISVTAEKWIPLIEVPETELAQYLLTKKEEGYALLGIEQTSNSINLVKFEFPTRSILLLGKEKEGIPVEFLHILDMCVQIPQLGLIRSLNVHVTGALVIWEYTRQQLHKMEM